MPNSQKPAPQPKQARAHSTIDVVLAEANKAIKEGGESAVRVQEISAKTNVSIGSIYHHFGDREPEVFQSGGLGMPAFRRSARPSLWRWSSSS